MKVSDLTKHPCGCYIVRMHDKPHTILDIHVCMFHLQRLFQGGSGPVHLENLESLVNSVVERYPKHSEFEGSLKTQEELDALARGVGRLLKPRRPEITVCLENKKRPDDFMRVCVQCGHSYPGPSVTFKCPKCEAKYGRP